MSALADFLEPQIDALARSWAERMGAQTAPAWASATLRGLVATLRSKAPAFASVDPAPQPGRHAQLRSAVLDLLEAKQWPISLAEARALGDFFDAGNAAVIDEVAASEWRMRTLLQSVDIAFCIFRMQYDARNQPNDYLFLAANPAFEQHTGLVNAVGKTIRQLVPDIDPSWFEIYGNVVRTGEPTRFENHDAALQRSFDAFACRVGPPEAREVGVIFTDITRRKTAESQRAEAFAKAQAAQAEAEARRRQQHDIFMQAPVAICILEGPQHTFTFANPPYRALVNGRDVVGKTLLQALPDVEKDGFHLLLDEVKRTQKPFIGNEVRLKLEHHMGDEVLILNFVYVPKYDGQGVVDGVLVSAMDVTELVQARERSEALAAQVAVSEGRLRIMTNALPVLVSLVNGDETYGFANRAYEDWFGIPSTELVGRTVRDVIGEAAYAKLGPFVKRGIAGERLSFEQLGVPYRHGGTRDVRVTFTPYVEPSGERNGYVALLEDVSKEKRAEETLKRQSEFEQQMIGIVSHDLRNPLNAISLGTTTLTRSELVDERTLKTVLRIQSSAKRATRMVEDLLDYTQARLGGGIPVHPRAADLHEVARAVCEEIEITAADRDVTVQHEGDGRGQFDADRLQQVVQNLVTNAVKYSPEGTPITVRTVGEGDRLTLSVNNRGDPIPVATLGTLFTPMQRGAAHANRADRSVGLGLFIVKSILEAHGGTIAVRSSIDEGTTFTATFPRGR